LRLENLHLSHTAETGYCTGAVLQFRVGCRDIHIERCQLLGSGSYGLCLEGVENLTLIDSVITDCTYGALSIYQSRRIRILNFKMEDNHGFHLLYASGSSDLGPVLFEDREFAENTWRRAKYRPYQPPPPADYRGNGMLQPSTRVPLGDRAVAIVRVNSHRCAIHPPPI